MRHEIRFERHTQTAINKRDRGTATTTCACGLHTGAVPWRRANQIAEEHADAVGLPDPLRLARQIMGIR